MLRLAMLAVLLISMVISISHAAGLKITEKKRTYRVSGSSVQAIVRSMTRRGPVSKDHGKRALGLADFRYKTNIKTAKKNGQCRVISVTIDFQMFYIVPKHSSSSRIRSRDRSKWRRIKSMIESHERQHMRYYRQFASELHQALSAMKPQVNCARFKTQERRIRKKLERSNKNRNRRYDQVQKKPFNRRLDKYAPNWR